MTDDSEEWECPQKVLTLDEAKEKDPNLEIGIAMKSLLNRSVLVVLLRKLPSR